MTKYSSLSRLVLFFACITCFISHTQSSSPAETLSASTGTGTITLNGRSLQQQSVEQQEQNNKYSNLIPTAVAGLERGEDGQFFTHINIGTPPQHFTASISTSTSQTFFASVNKCDNKNTYSATASSSSAKPPSSGRYRMRIKSFTTVNVTSYSPISTFALDKVCLGQSCSPTDNSAARMFRVVEDCLAESPDGIFGLLSDDGGEAGGAMGSLLDSMTGSRKLFSICLGNRTGSLAIGGTMPEVRYLDPRRTQSATMEGWDYSGYSMKMIGFDVNSKTSIASVFIPQIFEILTSEPLSFTPPKIFNHLQEFMLEAWAFNGCTEEQCGTLDNPTYSPNGHEYLFCVRQNPEVALDVFMSNLPGIVLFLDSGSSGKRKDTRSLIVKPEHHMINIDPTDKHKWCTSIVGFDHKNQMYLGSDLMRGYEWVFDLDRSEISWTPAHCGDAYNATTAQGLTVSPSPHTLTPAPTDTGEHAGSVVPHPTARDHVKTPTTAPRAGTSDQIAGVLGVLAVIFVCMTLVYTRPRAVAGLAAGPRRLVTTLLSVERGNVDGGSGDDVNDDGGVADEVCEMTSMLPHSAPVEMPTPLELGYDLGNDMIPAS